MRTLTPPDPPKALHLHCDRDALAANWRALDRLSGAADAGAAVKADGYGLGVDIVVPTLRNAGCRAFYVAHWSEVAGVIAHVPPQEVAVLHGPLSDEDAAYARATGVRPVLNSLAQVARWQEAGGGPCHLMIDTGINRLGLPMDALGDPALDGLEIEVALSHLACADEDSAMNTRQLVRTREAFAAIPAARYSLANSAGIALGPDYRFDLTRPGLALYGGVPRAELGPHIAQVAHPAAQVMQVRDIAAGESVGYNATFTATAPMRVGVVSLGYADGYLRCWSGIGALRHGEACLPVLGRVSMDMTVVDLATAPDIREGDWIDLPFHLPDAAAASGLSQYELLTTLGKRFRR